MLLLRCALFRLSLLPVPDGTVGEVQAWSTGQGHAECGFRLLFSLRPGSLFGFGEHLDQCRLAPVTVLTVLTRSTGLPEPFCVTWQRADFARESYGGF